MFVIFDGYRVSFTVLLATYILSQNMTENEHYWLKHFMLCLSPPLINRAIYNVVYKNKTVTVIIVNLHIV